MSEERRVWKANRRIFFEQLREDRDNYETRREPTIVDQINNIVIIIKEIHRIDTPFRKEYIAGVQVKDGDWISHVFHVNFTTVDELHQKIMTDIINYLNMKKTHGEDIAQKVM